MLSKLISLFKRKDKTETDWVVNTRYEFYRKHLEASGRSLTDIEYVPQIWFLLKDCEPLEINERNDFMFYTENLKLHSYHKRLMGDFVTRYKTIIDKLSNLSMEMESTSYYDIDNVDIPSELARHVEFSKSIGNDLGFYKEEYLGILKDRIDFLEQLLNNYNKEYLTDTYMFRATDIAYVLNRMGSLDSNVTLREMFHYLERNVGSETEHRALIAVVLHLYQTRDLTRKINKGYYLSDFHDVNILRTLYEEIVISERLAKVD